jgi:hypothetical protein
LSKSLIKKVAGGPKYLSLGNKAQVEFRAIKQTRTPNPTMSQNEHDKIRKKGYGRVQITVLYPMIA